MKAFFTKYGLFLAAVILFACGVYWSYHATYKKGYGAAMAEVQKKAQEQKDKSIATERQANNALQTKLKEVENEKQKTVAANQSMRTELERLQEYINTHQLPTPAGNTGKSESDAATRGWALFGQCTKEYAGMAEIADGQRDALAQWQAYGEVVDGMK